MGIEAAIIGSAVLGAGASVLGANKSAGAAKDAANAQSQASQQQIALQRDIYNDQVRRQEPYYQAGLQGIYGDVGLMNLLGMQQPGSSQGAPAGNGTTTQPVGTPQIAGRSGNVVYLGNGAYGPSTGGGMLQNGPQNAFAQGGNPASSYLQQNPDVLDAYHSQRASASGFRDKFKTPEQYAQWHYQNYGQGEGRNWGVQAQTQQPPAQSPPPPPPPPPTVPTASGETQDSIGSMTATLRQTPGYQFMLDESERAIGNSFASRGKLLSGAAMNALNDRTIGLADNTYQQAVNNQFNMANLGMGAAAQIQNAGNAFASGAGNAYGAMGTANANSAIAQGNAWNAGLQGVSNAASGGLGMYGAYKGWFS